MGIIIPLNGQRTTIKHNAPEIARKIANAEGVVVTARQANKETDIKSTDLSLVLVRNLKSAIKYSTTNEANPFNFNYTVHINSIIGHGLTVGAGLLINKTAAIEKVKLCLKSLQENCTKESILWTGEEILSLIIAQSIFDQHNVATAIMVANTFMLQRRAGIFVPPMTNDVYRILYNASSSGLQERHELFENNISFKY